MQSLQKLRRTEDSMTERFLQLLNWLSHCEVLKNADYTQPEPASNDASFRRYYRIKVSSERLTEASLIVMDAPPEHEDCEPFVRIAAQLGHMGLNVPKVLAQDLTQGFLLLTDLGATTYLSQLNADNAESYYRSALQALVQMQRQGKSTSVNPAPENTLPLYDEALLHTEMDLFRDWLLAEHLQIRLNATQRQGWNGLKVALADSALKQPQTYVHRDYHSRNLMVTEPMPGILDFQDAVKGAITYDAVSLLRDCYVTWPAEQVVEWQREYFLMLVQANLVGRTEWDGFVKAMDWMGMQRHLKASGIFARLYHRDGRDGYLGDIPTTLAYLQTQAERYAPTHWLAHLLEDQVLPAWERLS